MSNTHRWIDRGPDGRLIRKYRRWPNYRWRWWPIRSWARSSPEPAASASCVGQLRVGANVADSIPAHVLIEIREDSAMSKRKRNIGLEIREGLRELKRGDYGRAIEVPDVAEIREKVGLSQSRFATLLGVSVRTLQDWEQGRRAPSGAARTLLLVAHRNPRVLLEVA